MALAGDSFDGLDGWLWDELPNRKRFAGRRRVREMAELAIARWPESAFDPSFEDRVTAAVRARYGSFWIILLAPLIGELLKLLLLWWMQRNENRALIEQWKGELNAPES